MTSVSARFMLSVPKDIAKKAEALKKNNYRDKPYAEMYRHLIQLGIDSLEKEKTGNSVLGAE